MAEIKRNKRSTTTNNDFSRILMLLRKERNLSQKQAAADLGISQALLSHYEKGIRECGLDFVVRAADYYGVSCDYLLGRTPHRTGAVLAMNDISGENLSMLKSDEGVSAEYNRRVLVNSLNIVFGILKKINSESLSAYVSTYLFGAVYKAFRLLYSANPKNPQGIFSLDRRMSGATMESTMAMAEAKSRYILSGENYDDGDGIHKDMLPFITTESLSNDYPQAASCMLDLIKSVEKSAKNAY